MSTTDGSPAASDDHEKAEERNSLFGEDIMNFVETDLEWNVFEDIDTSSTTASSGELDPSRLMPPPTDASPSPSKVATVQETLEQNVLRLQRSPASIEKGSPPQPWHNETDIHHRKQMVEAM